METTLNENLESQENECLALDSIYESDDDALNFYYVKDGEKYLKAGQINISVKIPTAKIKIILLESNVKEETQNFLVQFLPPIVLKFVFPETYPSDDPPFFTISCKWLTNYQISCLCKELDNTWKSQIGVEILYEWVQFIQEETLKVLDLKELVLDVNRYTSKIFESKYYDDRAIQEIACFAEILPGILEHNEKMLEKFFNKKLFTCKICFSEKYGEACLQFKDCGHVYCKTCIIAYFRIQIQDGKVTSLTCPEETCESQAFPAQVKKLVSEEEFAKYERLLLQTTLDSMTDVVYCPRQHCQFPVILEPGETMGLCSVCKYAFCTYCKLSYHGISPCKLRQEELEKICHDFEDGDEKTKTALKAKYGAKVIEQKLQELRSHEWLKNNSKNCPGCSASVEKLDGCNKMTCYKCKTYFCWLCLRQLNVQNPYLHYNQFGGSCYQKLFVGVQNNDDLDDFVQFFV